MTTDEPNDGDFAPDNARQKLDISASVNLSSKPKNSQGQSPSWQTSRNQQDDQNERQRAQWAREDAKEIRDRIEARRKDRLSWLRTASVTLASVALFGNPADWVRHAMDWAWNFILKLTR